MRKCKRTLTCRVCGRQFSVEMGDCIAPKDAAILQNPRFLLHRVSPCKR